MRISFFILILLAFGIASCEKNEVQTGILYFSVDNTTLTIENQSSESLHYVVFERQLFNKFDWITHCRDDERVLSNQSINIPLSTIAGYDSNATELIALWWNCEKKNGLIIKEQIISLSNNK